MKNPHTSPSSNDRPPNLWRAAIRRNHAGLALGLALGSFGACVVDEGADEPWIGGERGAFEQVPDETPSYVDEAELRDVFGDAAMDAEISDLTADLDPQLDAWTKWYDRDDPSGNGDWELRYLQSGVCSTPTGVECRTLGGLALWETGEVVSCSVDGLLCLNSNQPDGSCNYDYQVKFLCPGCVSTGCGPGDCGNLFDNCGAAINCGPCCVSNGCGPGDCGNLFDNCGEPINCGPCWQCEVGICSNGASCCSSNLDCYTGYCNLL
jgi:Mucin-2 protein WxxW repeating region